MPTFYELLKPFKQKQLKDWYEKKFRKKFYPPYFKPAIEPSSEIPRIMAENREIKR